MDNSEIIENFESLLKQQSTKRSSSLYNDKINKTLSGKTANPKLNPQTIISNLAKQMKAIQNSENFKSYKKPPADMEKFKTSTFLPVNMLQEHKKLPHPSDPHKFDTQLISNTQLINIVEDAEALDVNAGMTQEFETTFFNGDDNTGDQYNQNLPQHNTSFPILDISLKEPDRNPILLPQKHVYKENDENVIKFAGSPESLMNTDTQFDNCAQILDQCIEVEDIDEISKILDNSTQQDISLSPCNEQYYTEAPLSPVFNVKNKKKYNNTSCLVYDLERFETFEKIAMPVIEQTKDMENARFLINSQIIGKELILQTCFEDIERISPVIEICDNPLKVDKELISTRSKHSSCNEDECDTKSKLKDIKKVSPDKCFLTDEILFSSDEEDEYRSQSYKDLPFTCALETSFYENFAVLDKTMYVGFQTASNKSIQIETESFSKAKGLLDSVEQDLKNETTLSELIEMCESNKVNAEVISSYNIANVPENSGIYEYNKKKVENIDKVGISSVPSVKSADTYMQVDLNEPNCQGNECTSNKMADDLDCVTNLPVEEEKYNKSDLLIYRDNINKTDQDVEKRPVNTKEQNIDDDIVREFQEEIMCSELDDIIKNKDSYNSKKAQLQKIYQRHAEPKSVRFSTASNKNIQISDAALAKSKSIFLDIDFNNKSETKNVVTEKLIDKDVNFPPKNISFRTASNKEIIICDEALAKTKYVFNDSDMTDIFTNNKKQSHASDINKLQIQKPINDMNQPSTSKLCRIEKPQTLELIVSLKPKNNSERVMNTCQINQTKLCGFQTASNKNITISAEALSISKNMFIDLETDYGVLGKDITDAEPPFFGFERNDEFIGLIDETYEKSQKIFNKLKHSYINEISDLSNHKTNKHFQDVTDNSSASYLNANISRSLHLGFKTTSNKGVKISERAKSREIFQDINENSPFDTKNLDSVINKNVDTDFEFRGFQTANNKKVKISEEALVKSKKLFQDLNILDSMETSKKTVNRLIETEFKGFQTASNDELQIYEEALARDRKIFQDISDHETAKGNSNNCIKNLENAASPFTGFRTASNKEVKISEAALAKSRNIFQDISDGKSILANEDNSNNKNDFNFKGFQTGNKKEVKISLEALANSRKLIQNIYDSTSSEINKTNQNTNTFMFDTGKKLCEGFQKASKTEFKVFEDALAKSRNIFQDHEITTVNTPGGFVNTMTSSPFMGFQTASKKQVKISEEALKRSRNIFKDINHVQSESAGNITKKERTHLIENTSYKGFQTASNKEVKISEESLFQSRKIFQDLNIEETTDINASEQRMTNSISTLTGFQTASKKQVSISEEALAKRRKIFDISNEKSTEDITKEEHTNVMKAIAFKGFQTASKKEVKVSEEALIRSRKMFQDIDIAEPQTNTYELDRNTGSNINFKGFQTANNEVVAISEEAIAKSCKLFQDLDDKERLNTVHLKRKDFFAEHNNKDIKQPKYKIELKVEQKCSENFEDIDTQMLNNFEVSMREVTPKISKRSGSPILSCPKSKKRKVFQIPYSQKSPKKTPEMEFKPPTVQKSENTYDFNATYKKTKSYNLKDLQIIEKGTIATENIDPYIQQFDFENILRFEFTGSRNDITKAKLTVSELKDLFLNSVNKKLVPDGWLDIQLKLIIWKLISYELKFPKTMPLSCTAKNVIEQLKFRYDKELYNAERPALRKIFEKDDTSTKTLILCVAAIYPVQDISQPPELLLTDGWYIIRTVIDKMLAKFVANGKITVGTKLVTHGAELVGSEQAVSPWEDTSSFRLKIFGNSTRRARWDARLGYHGNGAILSQLSNVELDGGKISKLRVFVTRVYPALYVDKFDDGSTVTRSERLEHLHQMKFENEREALLEKIYEDVEKEVLDQGSQDCDILSESGGKREQLDSGSQIAKKMKIGRDPAEFRSHLTSTQTALLEDHTTKERERLIQTIQTKVQDKIAALSVTLTRNVVTLFKVRVAGVSEKNGRVEVTRALLSIWRPNEAVIEIIKEGTWIEILNVVPTAMRYSELQISAGRQSVFSQSKYKESENVKSYIASLRRTCYPLQDLVNNPGMTTDCNEIDTVGIIFEIVPTVANFDANKDQFQNVYLTDLDKNMISVNFWGGLKKYGFEIVLDTGQIVACTNLQKRAGNSRKNIPQYRVTEFSYFTKTPKSETARKIMEELSQKLLKIDKSKFYEACVSLKTNYSIKQRTSENVTPYRFPNFDINSSKNRMFIDSPLAQNYNKKDENLNLSGLDFESTFKQDTQDLSPKTLLRKRQVKEKIAKLKRYGEPPPLSPMQIINKSKNAASAFRSPFSKSDVSPSVAICEKKLPNQEENSKTSDIDIQCSPVITMNRTYVKRSNPVKLDFSKNEISLNEAVDEFDCSPPLSLD